MKTIYVGNLNYATTEQDIRSLFQSYGTVVRVNLVIDRETGKLKGFCFVDMANDEEVERAIAALDGKELGGRRLRVNVAQPKGRRESDDRPSRRL